MIKYILASFTSGLIFVSCQNNGPGYDSWPHYGGSPEMIRYSTLSSIDTLNVAQLKLAWSYSSGDVDTAAHSQIQCNPIVINGALYGVSPQMKLFALDAATGEQQWIFDPNDPKHGAPKQGIGNVRGVSYWTDRKKDQRLFYTAGALTFAINAENGKPIPTFGTSGYIDLHNDLDRESGHLLVTATSPGMVYKDLLIMGTRLYAREKGNGYFIPSLIPANMDTIPGRTKKAGNTPEGPMYGVGFHWTRSAVSSLPRLDPLFMIFTEGKERELTFSPTVSSP